MKNHLPNPSKYTQGFYVPINPEKYRGKSPIRCLSSWEFKVCKMFDTNPSVLYWASESVAIPYINPVKTFQTGKQTISQYYPDYLVIYVDKYGKQHKEIVEVKPYRQTVMEAARTKKEKLDVAVNMAKWEAARHFAQMNGFTFRVITEKNIFA